MATSGTNYTGKWTLSNGVLTLAPKSGSSGQFRTSSLSGYLGNYVDLTQDEALSVRSIVFKGSLSFYRPESITSTNYVKDKSYEYFFRLSMSVNGFTNVETIDVTGLDCAGGTNFRGMFNLPSLSTIIGLSSMNVSSGTDFCNMFSSTMLESLDLTTFPISTSGDITTMLSDIKYLATVTFPATMNRSDTGYETFPYWFGLAPATNANGITVRNDEDFFKLPEGQQGGLWTRDISGTVKLRFSVSGTTREADKATITYSYATSTATGSLYIKKSSESSFPSEPAETFTLTGTGTGSIEVTLPTDDSYDVWIVVTDGNETIYTYPSIDSNILLFKIKKNKTVEDGEGYSIPHVEEGTTSITTTTGTLNSHVIARYGRMRMLRLAVQKSSATAVGANLYQGQINTVADRPLFSSAYGSGYYGSAGVLVVIAQDGTITVRVVGAQIAANGSTWCGVTYIAQGD